MCVCVYRFTNLMESAAIPWSDTCAYPQWLCSHPAGLLKCYVPVFTADVCAHALDDGWRVSGVGPVVVVLMHLAN